MPSGCRMMLPAYLPLGCSGIIASTRNPASGHDASDVERSGLCGLLRARRCPDTHARNHHRTSAHDINSRQPTHDGAPRMLNARSMCCRQDAHGQRVRKGIAGPTEPVDTVCDERYLERTTACGTSHATLPSTTTESDASCYETRRGVQQPLQPCARSSTEQSMPPHVIQC